MLAAVTDLAPADLTSGLHELADRCLLAAATNRAVELRHPLLAEAIRRRLVGPEAAEEHRRLAIALADRTEPEPAEVAEHWRHADDPGQEIVWRIRAARTAALRFAAALESEQWLRVIELWPDDLREAGTPPVTLAAVYVVAIDALKASMQFDRAIDVVAEAEGRLPDARIEDKAAILVRAADFRGARESADVGLALLEQALALYDELPLSEGHVHALDAQHNQLVLLGRFSEARQVATRAAQVAEAIGQASLHRQMLAIQAWHEADAGDVDRALRTATRAQALLPADVDPRGDIRIGVYVTDMLFRAGASAQKVEAAGARGLEAAATAGIESWQANLIRDNISQALIRAGLISRAATLIDPVTEGPYDVGHWPLHLERAHLDALRGLHAAARARMAPLRDDDTSMLYQTGMMLDRIDIVDQVALIDLWSGVPASALVLLHRLLDDVLGTTLANALGKAFVLTARAAADLAEREGASAAERRTHLRDLMLRRRRGPEDLFATGRADDPALGAAWKAETARLAGEPSIPLWVAAAAEWDKLDRPCDAAYSRWRGAQAALEAGQGTVAQRMLRHAARQAREHVPLTTAIIETEARARPKGPA
ncbi:hypothetical protein [Nocardioides panacihumi]|uniref:hypothetical protein n=1 Tax=Nocardioides panacihumi TaxID=400774 RepID=UPI0031CF13F1